MRKYELMFIIRTDVEQEVVDATVEKFANIVVQNGGELVKKDVIGKKRLAYEIDKHRDGIYVLFYFNAPAEVVAELDRVLKISDEVVRHLIVKDEA